MSLRIYAAFAAAALSTPATANILVNGGFEAAATAPYYSDIYAPNGHVQKSPFTTTQYLSGWTIQTPGQSDLYRGGVGYSRVPAAAAEGAQYFLLNWSDHDRTANLGAGDHTLRLPGLGTGNAWDLLIDNTVLTQIGSAAPVSSVPQPASSAMLLTGFAIPGAALRRRALIQRVAA